ncbi:MAG: VWA domain-containing protein [Pirellulaceae bacterium]|nr:BatA and WFA domain-containing protein [Planctomycetales bacterium]
MFEIFSSMLNWWQWLILLSIPPVIIALYFLKLRREPLEVPSTYLWHRTIEDMHVNSLWQRLRQNLLLLLQLIVLALLILACLRPNWQGTSLTGNRFIFMVDTSASMSATDVGTSRLDEAKKQVDALISEMKSGDAAMIVSFSDKAFIEQEFTTNTRELRRKLQAIKPTQRTSDITQALKAASGLANPGRSGERNGIDVQVAEALPADVYILTDGGLQVIPDFAWGNLRPVFLPVGSDAATNFAITGFNTGRNPEQPDQLQAFVRIHNFSQNEATIPVAMLLDNQDGEDQLLDATEINVPAYESAGTEFSLSDFSEGQLKLQLDVTDDLALDNVAYATVNPPQKARVLVVTPGNNALETVLAIESSLKIADISVNGPDVLKTPEYMERSDSAAYDLIIYDQCAPEKMPQASTLFIGTLPPGNEWTKSETQPSPIVIDLDVAHPLMKYISMGNVRFAEGHSVTGPKGQTVLMDSDIGPIFVLAPRGGYQDAVLGCSILGTDENGELFANTDWPRRISFPLFARNILEYLGGGAEDLSDTVAGQPGKPVLLRAQTPVPELQVKAPDGHRATIGRGPQNTYSYTDTDSTGIYEVYEKSSREPTQRFAVNLFDTVESDLPPRPVIETTWTKVAAQAGWQPTRRDTWQWILLAAIVVLLAEWYIYNRRVYL